MIFSRAITWARASSNRSRAAAAGASAASMPATTASCSLRGGSGTGSVRSVPALMLDWLTQSLRTARAQARPHGELIQAHRKRGSTRRGSASMRIRYEAKTAAALRS